ncbi:MAG: hypothetical protein HZB38_05170 [Planctomycetes bacterium]|nr:hypothetical protein [Planctomycetota bacterium]
MSRPSLATSKRPRRRCGPLFFAAVCAAAIPLRAWAGDERVRISGGPDGSGQNYQWTVQNLTTSPIVWIEFPHYHADQFTPPPGWTQDCTFIQVAGSEDRPGVCRAEAPSPGEGIAPSGQAAFAMRLSRVSAPKGRGTVSIRFADGSTTTVQNVLVPISPSALDRYLIPAVMGLLFLLAFWIHARKRRRSGEPAQPLEST